MLHIRCGDDILGALAEAGVPGERMRWADPLCLGPTPPGLPASVWRRTRSRFLSDRFGLALRDAEAYLDDQDRRLETWSQHEEIVLWFEHDLFDQVILIYLLDWFARRDRAGTGLSLIQIGDHPEVRRFTGLGQLDPDQLALLFPGRVAVDGAMLDLAVRAWRGFTAPSPLDLIALLEKDLSALAFLKPALKRHQQDYPWIGDGLSLTERLALEGIADGIGDPVALFRHVHDREAAPWMGDAMFWPVLDDLAAPPSPLIAVAADMTAAARSTPVAPAPVTTIRAVADDPDAAGRLRIVPTDLGLAVLAGEEDRVWAAGIDRWMGGFHLTADSEPWRWDDEVGNLALKF